MRHWTTSFHSVDAGLEDRVFEPPPSTRDRMLRHPLRSYFSSTTSVIDWLRNIGLGPSLYGSALVQSIPGIIEYKEFAAEDGEVLNIALFRDVEALRIWREHPRHREAMWLGYDRWRLSYDIRVCEVLRSYTRLAREQAPPRARAGTWNRSDTACLE